MKTYRVQQSCEASLVAPLVLSIIEYFFDTIQWVEARNSKNYIPEPGSLSLSGNSETKGPIPYGPLDKVYVQQQISCALCTIQSPLVSMRFQMIMAATIKLPVFWNVSLYLLPLLSGTRDRFLRNTCNHLPNFITSHFSICVLPDDEDATRL